MKKKLIIALSVLVIFLVPTVVLFFMKTDDVKNVYTDDEIKFKNEYEKNNGVEIVEGYVLKSLDIDSDNNVKYVYDKDIINLLSNGTNIIYFGWSDCNWCRTALPILLKTLKKNEIDTLYYYNFKELRNAYENKDEEKSKIYENIINIIGNDINTVFDENSTRANEKKILAPTVVFIKDGKYVGLHFKTVDSQVNSTDELDNNQKEELEHKYQELIDKINTNVCTTDEGC